MSDKRGRLSALTLATLVPLLVAGCSRSSSLPNLPLEEDFEGDCAWEEADQGSFSAGCMNGQYRVLLSGAPRHTFALELDEEVDALRFEVDATVRRGGDSTAYGVGCWSGEETASQGDPDGPGYGVGLSQDGGYVIYRDPGGTGAARPLVSRSAGGLQLDSEPTRLAIECVRQAGATTVVMRIDGTPVAVAKDEQGGEPLRWVGLIAGRDPGAPETEVRFDNAVAAELSENQAREAAARNETSKEASTGLPYEDEFALACEWPRLDTANVSASCADDAYRVSLKRDWYHGVVLDLEQSVDSLSFEIDATVRHIAGKTSVYGVVCWAGDGPRDGRGLADPGYEFVTAADAGWAIWRLPAGEEESEGDVLLLGLPGALPLDSGPNRIGAQCVRHGGNTTLVLLINGTPIAVSRTRDRGPFGWIGLRVSGDAGVEVAFDRAAAHEIDDEEARAIATMSPTPTPTGDPLVDAQLRALGVELD